jgi:GDP-L-fucose synthase
MKILLLGGTGMVGRAVQRELKHDGAHSVWAPARADLDLLRQSDVFAFFREHSFDAVIHAAARVGGIMANVSDPVGFLSQTSTINLNVIDGAYAGGVRNLIYVGSSCMYPRDYKNPLKETYLLEAPLEPTNEGYAIAKIMGAKLCEYYNSQYDTCYKTLIPPNMYGAYDDYDPTRSHLIAAIIQKLHKAKQSGATEVEVWGDGTARRELMFVDDLTQYITTVINRLDTLPDYLNVGCNADYSVAEYYARAADIVGYQGTFVQDTTKPVGMRQKLLDSSLAAQYGWKPRTALTEGLRRTYRSYLKSLESDVTDPV